MAISEYDFDAPFIASARALLITGTSIESATASDLLLGRVAGDIAWQPLALKNLLAADWSAILQAKST